MRTSSESRAGRFLLGVALLSVAALAGCASPDQSASDFARWASAQEFVASVDADSVSGSAGSFGMSAHLVVDGEIGGPELEALSSAAWKKALALGIAAPAINFIVGNAWGYSVDESGVHASAIDQLRDDPAFVGATVEYQPLDQERDDTDGVHGTVGSQAALRGAIDALVAAIAENGGDVDGVAVEATTADGAFGIAGVGGEQPVAAIGLWQTISGRVMPLAAHAAVSSSGAESLDIAVGTAEDQGTAEAIGAEHSDIQLTVRVATP